MGGEHGHRSHTDEQGEGQAVQGTLHPCKVREEGLQLSCAGGAPTTSPHPHGSEVTGVTQMGTETASCVTLGKPLDLSEPQFLHL